jgi:hypothetical protein
MNMRPFTIAYLASLATMVVLAISGGILLLRQTGPDTAAEAASGRHSFNVVTWELRHFPQKWLYEMGGLLTDRNEGRTDDEIIARYFALMDEIGRLERENPASSELDDAEAERAGLENVVEDIIEGRVADIVRDQGLATGPPPFTDMRAVLPPVDFELDSSPRVLVTSPRERISREGGYLLAPGLDLETVTGIEADVEEEDGVSALVVQTGGVATYPSVISTSKDYAGLVDTAFHEWLHQYLVMYPLGRSYFNGDDAQTLNESVANIAGEELAAIYLERYGDPTREEPAVTPDETPAEGEFDFRAEMRALRLEVEELLAAGKVDDAEALMDRKRDEFEEEGYYIRRLNQAYFAFHGSYADTPASIDPIGPRLKALFAESGSPGEFIRIARGIASVPDLEDVLSASD